MKTTNLNKRRARLRHSLKAILIGPIRNTIITQITRKAVLALRSPIRERHNITITTERIIINTATATTTNNNSSNKADI
jgi:hypothetical protein